MLHDVDAFTTVLFKGNPAAVCLPGGPVDDAWMQALAFDGLPTYVTAFAGRSPMSQPVEQLRQDALQRLLTIARELSASADLDQILLVIIDAMRDLLSADRATVFEYDPDTDELFSTVSHGLSGGADAAGEIRFPLSAGLAGEAGRTRRMINVPDAHEDARFNPEIDRQTGYRTRSLLTIPLEGYAGDLIGVAQVLNKSDGPFTAYDEEIAAALAAQAAVAMKRGRLIEDRLVREKLERDLKLAREIQQSSFPSELPRLERFDIEAWSEPAEQTGGDTYDVVSFETDGAETGADPADRAVLLLADATGHGVGPAISVTQVRSMLRMAVRLNARLGDIAAHMNRQLCHDLPPGRFITTWLGELDSRRSTLTSFSAGQGPILHYHAATGAFTEVEVDAVPLGILADMPVEVSNVCALEPGDVFAVISDGIFEALDPASRQFGTERVMSVIGRSADESAAGILTALRDAVDDFCSGRPADDDRTVIIMRRQPD